MSLDLQRLKQQVEEAEREVNRLEGRKQQLEQGLKKDFDCNTVKEAEELIQELRDFYEKRRKEFEKAKEKFTNDYNIEGDEQ